MLMKCDASERFTFVNKAYARHRARPPQDIIGRTVREVTGEDAYQRISSFIQLVLSGEAVEFETQMPYPELGLRHVAVSYVPEMDPAGRVLGWVSAITDLTEMRQAQADLKAQHSRQAEELAGLSRRIEEQAMLFDATLSHLSDLIYTFDHEGRLIYANKVLLDLWGRSLPEVVGKRFIDMNYPAGLGERLHAELLQVVATGKPVNGETPFRDANGREDLHEYVFNPVFGTDGKVVAMAGTTRLITDRRRAENSHRQLAAIVESSDDAIISKNLNGIVKSWNSGAQRLFGYKEEEVVGKSIKLLIPQNRWNEETEILDRILSGHRMHHYETIRQRKDGTLVDVSLSVSPIKDRDDRVIGVSKIARDITEQKKIEKALMEAKEQAEQASQAKDQFLAILSHELRTPLTPVLMTAAARQMDPNLSPEIKADMDMIRRNIELETRLIDDLLDLSRITSGKLTLRLEAVDLNEAVEHVCEICRPQILEKGLRLHVEKGAALGRVNADPSRLQQVLWNVLKNAAKFTPEGGDIFVTTRKAAGNRIEVIVRDTGAGIPREMLSRIFIAFEQGDAGITRQFGGLGLGLSISRALLDLQGGSIRVDSPGAGLGSVFTIELPSMNTADSTRSGSSPDASRYASGSLRLLVVEDHSDTATMLALLLRTTGHRVEIANDVAGALKLAETETFDLMISDVGLPDATGYELMQKIRQVRPIRGIAMSGFGMDEDMRKSFAAGFSEHLVKPVNFAVLEQTIRRVMEKPL